MIEVTFSSSTYETSAFGLTQWDKGQKLKIIWEDIPDSFQVHFSSRDSQEAIVVEATGESGVSVVEIPDELLKASADIFAWIYLCENGSVGESVKRAVLYVRPRAKPHSAIEDLEPTQQEKLESILSDINERIEYMKENGVDAEYIPDYIKEEADRVAKKVSELQNDNTAVFILASDAHLKTGDYNSETAIRHMSQAMRLIAERCPADFAAYLGDMTSGGSNKDISEAKTEIMNVNSALFPVFSCVPSLRCAGSEDSLNKAYYRNGDYITSADIYSYIGSWNKDAEIPKEDKIRGYCYRDFENVKLRVICLNTSDTYGVSLVPDSETALMSAQQLQWFCESLDLSSKTDSENWGIIILGHHPLNMTDKFPVALSILEAYVSGGSIDIVTDDSASVAYDFAGKNSAVILAQFHGHLHNFRVNFVTDNNIPLIAIPNASYYDNNFYSDSAYTYEENTAYGEAITYNKVVNTAEDTAFCVVVIDRENGEINAVHYGAGKDRTVIGGSVTEETPGEGGTDGSEDDNGGETEITYTNLIPYSTGANDNSYNKVGYIDGYKLTSTGNLSYATGYTNTGYMPADYGDIIRISGGTYDGSVGNYMFVYDGSYNLLWVASLKGVANSLTGMAYTDSGILVFTPSQVQTGTLTDMKYFRVSTIGQGSSLIATVNEKIDDSEILDETTSPVTSYTNIVQYATDEDENTYGTNGYKDNCSLTSTGEEAVTTGYVVTGYLAADTEAVIRIKNITFDGSEGCYLCIYDENFAHIKAINLREASDSANGIKYSSGLITFTPASASTDFSSMAYFRLSGKGIGDSLIITYCEEIT